MYMEYVYAAMLLHKAGKPIDEDSVTKVLKAVGIETEATRVKALVAALSEIDIEEAIKSAPALIPTAAPVAPAESTSPATEEEPKEEESEEEKKEEALEGLGALFG